MTSIRWRRVDGLAFALEAVLFITLVPLLSRLGGNTLFAVIGAGCAVFGYATGWLAARGLAAQRVLHGFLVGVLATIIYLAIVMTQPGGVAAATAFYGTSLFVAINVLKLAACTAGSVQL